MTPASSKDFPDIQANIECRFTLKLLRDMIKTCTQMHRTDKYSQHSSIIWPVRLSGWVFVYRLSGCGFSSRCCHLITVGSEIPFSKKLTGFYMIVVYTEKCFLTDFSFLREIESFRLIPFLFFYLVLLYALFAAFWEAVYDKIILLCFQFLEMN